MRVLKNALYLGAMQLSNILVALIVTPYITRIFGSQLLGINSFALAVVTNFSIFGLFGITLYGLREIAKVRDNPILLQQTFSRCITFQLFFSTLALLGYLVWILTTNDGYAPYYLLFTLYLLGTATDLTWFYGGLERFDRVAIRTVLMRVLGGLLVFVVVRRADQLYLLILIQQGSVFLSNLFYWLPLRRYGVQVSLQPLRRTLQKMFTPSLLLFLPIVFTTLLLTIDRILLGYLSTKQEVAIYDYTARLVRIAIIVVSVLGNVLLPRFAYLWSNNQRDEFNTTLRKQQFYSLFSRATFCYRYRGLCTPLRRHLSRSIPAPSFFDLYRVSHRFSPLSCWHGCWAREANLTSTDCRYALQHTMQCNTHSPLRELGRCRKLRCHRTTLAALLHVHPARSTSLPLLTPHITSFSTNCSRRLLRAYHATHHISHRRSFVTSLPLWSGLFSSWCTSFP